MVDVLAADARPFRIVVLDVEREVVDLGVVVDHQCGEVLPMRLELVLGGRQWLSWSYVWIRFSRSGVRFCGAQLTRGGL